MDEDLNYLIDLDVDSAKVTRALGDVEEGVNAAGAKAGKSFDPMVSKLATAADAMDEINRQLEEQRKKVQETSLMQEAANDPAVIRERIELFRKEAEIRHKSAMAELDLKRDPAFLKQMVEQEIALGKAREAYNEAKAKETRRQEGEGMPGAGKRIKELMQGGIGNFVKDIMGKLAEGKTGEIGEQFGGIFRDVKSVFGNLFGGGAKSSAKPPPVPGAPPPVPGAAAGEAAGGEAAVAGEAAGAEAVGGVAAGLGGMAAAVAGPIGLAVVGAGIAAKALGPVIAAPAEIAKAGLEGVAHGLHELQGPLGVVGLGFDMIGGAMSKVADIISGIPIVGDLLGPFAQALAGIPGILKDITGTLTQMAGVAAPGQLKLFNMALEDTQGVIGRAFVPVLSLMREAVVTFGDVLASVLPNTGEMSSALGEVGGAVRLLSNELRDVFAESGPQIRQVILSIVREFGHFAAGVMNYIGGVIELGAAFSELYGVIRELVSPLLEVIGMSGGLTDFYRGLGDVLRDMAHWVTQATRNLRQFLAALGLVNPQGPREARTQAGAAAREATFSSIDEFQRQSMLEAFRQPGSVGMEEVPNLVGGISTTLSQIQASLGVLTTISNQIATVIGTIANPAQAAQDAAQAAANALPIHWTKGPAVGGT